MLRCKFQFNLTGLMITCLLVFAFASGIAAQKQNKRIELVDVLGNRRLTDEEIFRHIKTRSDQMLDEKQLQKDLQSLLALGLFDTTDTRVVTETGLHGGVNVIFEVRELPLIVGLDFGCLRYITEQEITAILRAQKIEIKAGVVYEAVKILKARRIILDYLRKRGFTKAVVGVSEEEVNATTVKITFFIKELPTDPDVCGGEN